MTQAIMLFLPIFFVKEKPVTQYTSFYVIVKQPDNGRNSRPKHVVINK
jgi:hypothetical protein